MPKYIIVVMVDQHTPFAMGCYGNSQVKTPYLDEFAQHSIVFRNAYTSSPVCVPARFSALSGLYPSRTGCVSNQTPLPAQTPTMAHVFREKGYMTGFVGKMHPVAPHTHGFDYYVDFGHYFDYLGRYIETYTRGMQADDSGKGVPWITSYQNPKNSWNLVPPRGGLPCTLAEEDQFENFVVRESTRFLRNYRRDPLLLFVSFLRPHTPLVVPPRFYDLYREESLKLDEVRSETFNDYLQSRVAPGWGTPDTATLARRHVRNYYAAVSYVDEQFGALCATLRHLNMWDDTLMVYTSDHGEMLYQHGMVGKFTFYESSVRVPLMIHLPMQTQGHLASSLVDHTCLLPTLMGLSHMQPHGMDGRNISQTLIGDGRRNEATTYPVFSELTLGQGHVIRMVRDKNWKLVQYPDGFAQLFDLDHDPNEFVNCIGQEVHQEQVLQALLEDHIEKIGGSRHKLAGPNPHV